MERTTLDGLPDRIRALGRTKEYVSRFGVDGRDKITVESIIPHPFSFDKSLAGKQTVDEPGAMGILLAHGCPAQVHPHKHNRQIAIWRNSTVSKQGQFGVAFIDAGCFTGEMLLSLLAKRVFRTRSSAPPAFPHFTPIKICVSGNLE